MENPGPDLIQSFDLRTLSDAFYADPYPTYRALRERDPVHRCPDGSYFLTRHADVNWAYRHPKVFKSDKRAQFEPMFGKSPLFEHHTTSLVFNDPPLHTSVRKAIGDALSPKVVAAMEPDLIALVDGLLDRIEDKGQCDLMQEFAAAIPIEVIGNFLDIERAERGPLRRWSNAILGALEFGSSADVLEEGNRAVTEFVGFLEGLIAARRVQPRGNDIVSRLIRWESNDFKLSEFQIYHQCIFLLNAGHETTTNLIGNGVLALINNPGELERLRRTPALIDRAVEEFLRFESPVQLGNRTVTEPTGLGGVVLEAGTVLTLCIGAANRDPHAFVEPDRLDIAREPNPHTAFGGGIHTCAGLAVARLEAKVAIARFLARFDHVERVGTAVRAKRARFRGLESLPLACL